MSAALVKRDVTLSKVLSWLLRHAATKEGLTLSTDGFIKVAELLEHPNLKGKYTVTDVKRVVETNDKQRFTLRSNQGILEIRANQGHSLSAVGGLELIPLTNHETIGDVIHGTYVKNLDLIRKSGLSRMNRNHIHFASALPHSGQVISGARRNAEIFIYIDTNKALDDGIKFFKSSNDVILSPGDSRGLLVPKYFLKITKADGTIIN